MTPEADWADVIWRRGLAPDPAITVHEWAERFRMLPATAAEPGRWRTSRTPYLREPMEALSPGSGVDRVVVMAAAQTGKSELLLNFTGAAIQLWPALILLAQPTFAAASRFVRTRLDPMLDATPELRDRIVKPGPRKSGNSNTFKAYPGGSVSIVGANSAVSLRSTPARFVLLDEIDAYPPDVGEEGDPVALAMARTATFKASRKILLTSTPTLEGVSRIAAAYAETDQRRLFWPCGHCGEAFTPDWSQIGWPEDHPERAYLACPACGGIHEQRDQARLIAEAEWQPTAEGEARTAGFHVHGLASPFTSWGELAVQRVAAERETTRLQVWTNTGLGLPYEDRETAPLPADTLAARAEESERDWIDLLPDGVAVVTCGVDVQDDRLEAEFVGWGLHEESWSLDYQIIHGDTARPEVWAALDRLIARRFRHPRAVADLPVAAITIDHGGHRSAEVSQFAHERAQRRVWAIKGRGGPGVSPWPRRPPKPRRGGVAPVFIVGVDGLKRQLYDRLRIGEPGPGYAHFPAIRDHWWFSGLVAERPVRRWHRGAARIEWVVDRGVRNEPLDCRVYATAALHGLYASGLSLTDQVAKIAAAPLRTGGDSEKPSTSARTSPDVRPSKWMAR